MATPTPTAILQFKYPWRPYQARVLEHIDRHIRDRRLHIVAAPGSGKTTLGLEVFRLLNQPTVVLSPTRTIRDQWIKRLQDFMPPGDAPFPPEWVSNDWSKLAFFNSVTYQALHTEYRTKSAETLISDEAVEAELEELQTALNEKEIRSLVARLEQAGIKTLILDEAHHLRAEWWKALNSVVEGLPDLHLVALTATPPYDVTGQEWNRYQELCGPIDEEISVPELVKVGTLCPHQDFVYAIEPAENDRLRIQQYEAMRRALFAELLQDDQLLAAIQAHPFMVSPSADTILAKPEVASAMLSYCKTRGVSMSAPLVEMLGVQTLEIPPMNPNLWQALIKSYLFDSEWGESPHREELTKRLRRDELLNRRELRLNESKPAKRLLALSSAKILACVNIYQMERKVRGVGLRQVILTDFIRDDGFDSPTPVASPQLGSSPLFENLLKWMPPEERSRVGLLTGRVMAVHQDRLPDLKREIGANFTSAPLTSQPEFVRVNGQLNQLTNAFTHLLMNGDLHVLIGTRALLGEGWDAPVVNSLILASYVGSFMLTNQMRGRAIRIDPKNTGKASSIWHIVAVDPDEPTGYEDMVDLHRRFETFVGLSHDGKEIESGLNRLKLPLQKIFEKHVNLNPRDVMVENNNEMQKRLEKLPQLRDAWHQAIISGEEQRILPSIEMVKPPRMESFHFTRILAYFLAGLADLVAIIFIQVLLAGRAGALGGLFWILFAGLLAVGLFVILPRLVKSALILARHYPVDGSLKQIGLTVRDALCEADLMQTTPQRLKVNTVKLSDGSYSIMLTGGTFFEQSLFADCIAEILGVIENPRYLITREGKWLKLQRVDYHAVPMMLAANKERAKLFWEIWERRISPARLIYTRTPEGRQELLKARGRAFSTQLAPKSERRDRWQ